MNEQINIFSIPLFKGTIDVKKVKLKNKDKQKLWISRTLSTYNSNSNIIEKQVGEYVLNTIANIMNTYLKNKKYRFELDNMWTNYYKKGSFQEPHIHSQSHFSFIIYKKIKKSNTIFFNPSKYMLTTMYNNALPPEMSCVYKPVCKTGDIIIFPSFVEHMVAPSEEEGETIAGNFNLIQIND